MLLEGSLARGDASAAADVDLRVLLTDGMQRPFSSEVRDGVRVEVRHADFEQARSRLAKRIILEGLWAVNERPVPPIGSVLARLDDLSVRPDDADALLQRFLVGTADERLAAAGALLEWLDLHLSQMTEPATD